MIVFTFFTLKLSLNCLLTDRITYTLPIHFWSAYDSSAIQIVFTYLILVLGNYYVKFGHFSGKNHVKFGNFYIFSGNYLKKSGIMIIFQAGII